jgi:hypothetical protein
MKYGMWLYEVDDFGDIRPSMVRMIDDYFPYYENADDKESLKGVTISNSGGETCTIKYYYEDETKNKSEDLEMTQKQKEDFDKVRDAYFNDYGYFTNICIKENEIYFFNVAPYYIVYTLDGMKPEKDPEWFYERLCGSWYQCVKIPEKYLD